MRRNDRKVTDKNRILEVIEKNNILRVGFADNGEIYIVPVNYGFTRKDGKAVFYFHGAFEGRKYELIEKAPPVGFELDSGCKIIPSASACAFSAAYVSVIGTGRAEIVSDEEEKRLGLGLIMQLCTGKGDWSFSSETLKNVCVFKLTAESFTCKEHTV